MPLIKQGLIVKATGGFYYVQCHDDLYECRARGLFRKEGLTPYVGDSAEIEITGEQTGYIVAIKDRKNSLIRPPLANIDRLALVISAHEPEPNAFVTDKMITIAERRNIEPVIIMTKVDLGDYLDFGRIYESGGFKVFYTSKLTGQGIDEIGELFSEGITAFTGNTGTGKSSLLNAIDSGLSLPTASISKKLGRGRHTTRHVELFKLDSGGYVADTPGFSAVELEQFELMLASELENLFREFEPYLGKCKFTGCSHICEKGCVILEAVKSGEIHPSRHKSYTALYNQLRDVKEWQLT